MTDTATTDNIEKALARVYALVGYVQKDTAPKLAYSYAGEAALINAVRPHMTAEQITMRVVAISDIRRDTYTTSHGAIMHQTILHATIRFTHAPSGTYVDCEAVGEGADSGDKSANKAMTGAYKYAIRQTFMIETGDDPDKTPSSEQERATIAPRPAWVDLLSDAVRSRGLTISDCKPVIGKDFAKDNFQTIIGDWFKANPGQSVDTLVARAAELKDTNNGAE